jgi:hypothetical protein
VIKDIKNHFCNNKYNISPEIFLYFVDFFEMQGKLEEHADRVVARILQPVADDDDCLDRIISKSDFYKDIVIKAGDDATEFKEIMQRKLATSENVKLTEFAAQIGVTK